MLVFFQFCFFNLFPNSKFTNAQIRYDDDDEDEGPQPDSTLEQGVPLPVRMHGSFPPELSSTPLEDIDNFYSNQRVSS
jgi:voltage-gated sodium channel type II alpha